MTEFKYKVGDKVKVNFAGICDDVENGMTPPTGNGTITKIFPTDELPYEVADDSNVSWYKEDMIDPVSTENVQVTSEIDKHTVDVIADYFCSVIDASDTAEQMVVGFSGYIDGLQAALHEEEGVA